MRALPELRAALKRLRLDGWVKGSGLAVDAQDNWLELRHLERAAKWGVAGLCRVYDRDDLGCHYAEMFLRHACPPGCSLAQYGEWAEHVEDVVGLVRRAIKLAQGQAKLDLHPEPVTMGRVG